MYKILLLKLLLLSSISLFAQYPNYSIEYDSNIIETPVYEASLLEEMSGICPSRRYPGHFWVHNDSGDDPMIYLLDTLGNLVTYGTINGVNNKDWEDIVSFEKDGKYYLMIGAFGDNNTKRTQYQLVLMEEPEIDLSTKEWNHDIIYEIKYAYQGGTVSYNHESLAVDLDNDQIFVITKRGSAKNTMIFSMPLSLTPISTVHEPVEIGRADIDAATGMDISDDNHRAIIISVEDLIEYTRYEGETWGDAFSRAPRRIVRPSTGRTEAVCYNLDGKTIHIVREGTNHPMFIIPVLKIVEIDDEDNEDKDENITSLQTEFQKRLQFYPNPSQGVVNIEYAGGVIDQLFIYNLEGKLIRTYTDINQSKITLNKTSLSKGIYMISLKVKEGIIKKKLMMN
ncbi:T9SS type A sorting domain-containing protein [Flammeovirga sp. EKP202]|uniref:T9SS type A sorting domain-containing protein n=1 Tax=Flammeovirga sp. EKP202 TaxID=2770592 RepID=UPI00165FDE33|nr:T9SS type A sorting domain-containing protein [Flammeovirga sp. EKP202]MBD0405136.1 T9SS type A sorting domain-containing protein [Flammeovirga sp. EKP202]